MTVCSQDYYWYEGTKIPLERGCRMYIIYEDDKLSESDKSQIVYSEDVFYDEIPNLKWGKTSAHAVIKDTAHVHYSTISYRKDGDYYDNMLLTHRFYVKLKNQEDLPLLQELAAQNNAEIEREGSFSWHILRCKLDAPKNALELANLFYETTDLFIATEPEMINIRGSEWPKAIKSLCDQWNILGIANPDGYDHFHTFTQRLTTDTVISSLRYKRLEQDGAYLGALREGDNRDIYYIPNGSTHEYLLYAFNAKVGDALSNLWIGGEPNMYPDGWRMTVEDIQETIPRTFVLSTGLVYTGDGLENAPLYIYWREGVGLITGPIGDLQCVDCDGDYGQQVLCAYNNGEQVYTSEYGEKYGCYCDSSIPKDTISLYFIKDGPGSSTVEPVDPNQIVAMLQKDMLSIYEFLNKEIGYKLSFEPIFWNHAPKRALKESSFHESVSVQLTESGKYTLELTCPDWDYSIVGTFDYLADQQAIEHTDSPVPSPQKILQNGQLLLRKGDHIYTITGTLIQ